MLSRLTNGDRFYQPRGVIKSVWLCPRVWIHKEALVQACARRASTRYPLLLDEATAKIAKVYDDVKKGGLDDRLRARWRASIETQRPTRRSQTCPLRRFRKQMVSRIRQPSAKRQRFWLRSATVSEWPFESKQDRVAEDEVAKRGLPIAFTSETNQDDDRHFLANSLALRLRAFELSKTVCIR
ncbi:hypothetical protein Pla52o_37460 [Novipirellula galeiformis]|uniref:Uncharacterized protein n=1 Tax=Novipirellula galeiformis TaxID=2528004 RepID=A0A5C6CFN4_9BACT|nr:hypothetical protein Pla52o_37460 [Novipirellula galeiformis]